MTALTTGSPLLDVYRLASLIGAVAAESPVLVQELADAQLLLAEAESKSEIRFAEARVENCERALVTESQVLREAAALRAAR